MNDMIALEQITAAWSRTIVPAVRAVSIPLSAILSEAIPTRMDGNKLAVTLEGTFHRNVVSDTKNVAVINDVLWDVTGENLSILFEAPVTEKVLEEESSYAKYLKSDHWQHMREIAEEHYGKQCNLCGSTTRVETHHRTYDRIGRERLGDLTRLCRKCHSRYHGKTP